MTGKQLGTRISQDLYDRLVAAARARGVSLNVEITGRLEAPSEAALVQQRLDQILQLLQAERDRKKINASSMKKKSPRRRQVPRAKSREETPLG